MTRVLVAEDEPGISSFVRRGLTGAGYEAVVVDDGGEALRLALAGGVDLVLLDVGLPTMDGFTVLRHLRAAGVTVPVIMLTARTSTADTVEGLDAGASDYVAKPFTVDELLARIRSRLREAAPTAAVSIVHRDVVLDPVARRARIGDRTVELSAREFAVAEQFLRRPGEVLSRGFLHQQVWGLDFDPGTNVVDVYVRYLRAKFGADRIATIRGEGYRWQ